MAQAVPHLRASARVSVWREIDLAISSARAISSEKISTSCPPEAIWSPICVTSVVLPSEEIAPTMYSPSYSPPSSARSSASNPVGRHGVLTLSAMPSTKACKCPCALVCK